MLPMPPSTAQGTLRVQIQCHLLSEHFFLACVFSVINCFLSHRPRAQYLTFTRSGRHLAPPSQTLQTRVRIVRCPLPA